MAGAVSYNSANETVTFTPSAVLAYATTYTVTVSGAKDTAGDSMSGPVTWTFTTAAATTLTTAVFIKRDSTTEGNWIGTYGTEGYDIANSGTAYHRT